MAKNDLGPGAAVGRAAGTSRAEAEGDLDPPDGATVYRSTLAKRAPSGEWQTELCRLEVRHRRGPRKKKETRFQEAARLANGPGGPDRAVRVMRIKPESVDRYLRRKDQKPRGR